jgi:hypothetical protein
MTVPLRMTVLARGFLFGISSSAVSFCCTVRVPGQPTGNTKEGVDCLHQRKRMSWVLSLAAQRSSDTRLPPAGTLTRCGAPGSCYQGWRSKERSQRIDITASAGVSLAPRRLRVLSHLRSWAKRAHCRPSLNQHTGKQRHGGPIGYSWWAVSGLAKIARVFGFDCPSTSFRA